MICDAWKCNHQTVSPVKIIFPQQMHPLRHSHFQAYTSVFQTNFVNNSKILKIAITHPASESFFKLAVYMLSRRLLEEIDIFIWHHHLFFYFTQESNTRHFIRQVWFLWKAFRRSCSIFLSCSVCVERGVSPTDTKRQWRCLRAELRQNHAPQRDSGDWCRSAALNLSN